MKTMPVFDSPQLAATVETLTPEEIDQLPFGVIGLDANDRIRVYNRTEAQNSGYRDRPARGRLFFEDVAPCLDNGYFKSRIERARRAGTLDISFAFIGDFADREREFKVRVQSATDGGCWIFHQRPC
jgi:photoactive yellow protein